MTGNGSSTMAKQTKRRTKVAEAMLTALDLEPGSKGPDPPAYQVEQWIVARVDDGEKEMRWVGVVYAYAWKAKRSKYMYCVREVVDNSQRSAYSFVTEDEVVKPKYTVGQEIKIPIAKNSIAVVKIDQVVTSNLKAGYTYDYTFKKDFNQVFYETEIDEALEKADEVAKIEKEHYSDDDVDIEDGEDEANGEILA